MNVQIFIKVFWGILLVAIAMLVALTMDSHPIPSRYSADNLETINVAPYSYGITPPFSLGAIKNPDAYIHLKLRFRVDSTESYPNVFQTAQVNSGIRMEISGSAAAIVVPDLTVPGGLKGLTLTTSLQLGQWYTLEVEALNGTFVHVTLDEVHVADYASTGISMDTSQLLVGGGFDSSRTFRGQIENISVTKGNLPKSWVALTNSISPLQWLLIFLCGTAFLMTIRNSDCIVGATCKEDTNSPTLDNAAMFGVSLAFVIVGLFLIHHFGEKHLGVSKWLALILLPVSLVIILLVLKQQSSLWKWARWPLSLLFLLYVIFIVRSIGYKDPAYDAFILSMLLFSPLAYGLTFAKASMFKPDYHLGRMYFALSVPIGISILFFSLSWCSLFDLTNWQAIRQAFDDSFSVSTVAAFLVLRAVFAILFEQPKSTNVFAQYLHAQVKYKSLFTGISIDIAVIAIFFWISFRHDTLFMPDSESHWEYFVGVVQGIRNGGWLLWDTPSQYGFLNVLLASIVPSASAWQSFYIFQGILLFLVSTGIYLAARRYTSTAIFQRIAVFAVVFMSLFFADPDLIGPYPFPSSSVVRFFCVYALVLVAWFIPKFGMRQAIVLSIVWSLTVIWSAESAIYGTAIFLFILVALIQTNTTENHRLALAGKYIGVAAICLTTTMVVIFAFYIARLGVAPDLSGYYEHALGYAGGFGYVPFPLSGPGNLLFLGFMGISILCIGVIHRGKVDQENVVAPLAAMAGCIWGVSTYYIGRPVPQNITAMLPIIVMVTYLAIILSKRAGAGAYSLPIKAAAFPLLFLVLIPVFTPKWISNLSKIQSFSSNISSKLPEPNDELKQLFSRAKLSADTPIIYYGNEAAPPIFSGDYVKNNDINWLPIPLQLLEPPVSEARRNLYLNRYICRNKPRNGVLVNKMGDAIELRLEGFLHELHQFYDVVETIPGSTYTLYRFSGINLQHCPATLANKI